MKSLYYLLILFLLSSCSNEYEPLMLVDVVQNFDVILVAGQSNTHYGEGLNQTLDQPDDRILQLGRFGSANLKIAQGKEPLEHYTATKNHIGFALTFAKSYADEFLYDDRHVLIIPCGFGGTGFITNDWNKGDALYDDAVFRTNYVLDNFPGSSIKAILWHQGETDIGNSNYQNAQDQFIQDIRANISADSIPLIVGGMLPYWVNQSAERMAQQNIIETTPDRLANIGYADPIIPFVIDKGVDDIHFDAAGQRELGKRYFEEYKRLSE